MTSRDFLTPFPTSHDLYFVVLPHCRDVIYGRSLSNFLGQTDYFSHDLNQLMPHYKKITIYGTLSSNKSLSLKRKKNQI